MLILASSILPNRCLKMQLSFNSNLCSKWVFKFASISPYLHSHFSPPTKCSVEVLSRKLHPKPCRLLNCISEVLKKATSHLTSPVTHAIHFSPHYTKSISFLFLVSFHKLQCSHTVHSMKFCRLKIWILIPQVKIVE